MSHDHDPRNGSKIPFRMHPRVFSALGADLVTNDVVAVIELVKNSYDAFAENVWLRFRKEDSGEFCMEIEDDGHGMTRQTIEDVWCVVATPHKELNPYSASGERRRRVVGEKGLGRLSVARLGNRLSLITRTSGGPCHEVEVNWQTISSEHLMDQCYAYYREYKGDFRKSGTLLRIRGLTGVWDEHRMADLRDNLARLISPFSSTTDFNIYLSDHAEADDKEVKIVPPGFLEHPKYAIYGDVDEYGNVVGTYEFEPIDEGTARTMEFRLGWEQIYDEIRDKGRYSYWPDGIRCGSFSFNIRAWDIGSEDTREISDRYDLKKSIIRKAISAHKGISIYRDGILVLPKSDSNRDWLGLDLRRISKVGLRVSTSQLVGYVAISADANPRIEDTSDRERLASRVEVAEFEEILKAIIGKMETERKQDRATVDGQDRTTKNIFDDLSPTELQAQSSALMKQGADAKEIVPLINDYVASFESGRKQIEQRLASYSHLATIGTIAQMLIHEIRNRTTIFGSFVDFVMERFGPATDPDFKDIHERADKSIDALERLADTFSPLANRTRRRKRRKSIVEDCIRDCLSMVDDEIRQKNIKCSLPETKTHVAVDPGELESILLNLTTNALYWLGQTSRSSRKLEFSVDSRANDSRVIVSVDDSGPGVDTEDLDKVLLPGVTRKPGGIGMGLTVASELVEAYRGNMMVRARNGNGVSFSFDLPMAGGQ